MLQKINKLVYSDRNRRWRPRLKIGFAGLARRISSTFFVKRALNRPLINVGGMNPLARWRDRSVANSSLLETWLLRPVISLSVQANLRFGAAAGGLAAPDLPRTSQDEKFHEAN